MTRTPWNNFKNILGGVRHLALHGPEPLVPVPKDTFGKVMYDSLIKHQSLPVAFKDAVTGETVSYKTVLNKSCRLAATLKDMGVKANDTIGILSENNVHYFYPVLAALYSGIIATPFSANSTPRELIHYNNISKPKIIFCSESMYKLVKEAKPHLKHLEKIVITNSDEYVDNIETIDNVDCQPEVFNPRDQIALIMYSSGTTGIPKGVAITHTNMNVNCSVLRDPRILRQPPPGTSYLLGNLPFNHVYGMVWALRGLLVGTPIVIMNKFDPHVFLKTIQDHQIKTIILVPPLVQFLASHPMVDQYDISCVDDVLCAAAFLRPELELAAKKRLNLKCFRQGLGMTEAVVLVINRYGDIKQGSVGKIVPYLSAKVVDVDTRKELGPNRNGEFLYKGDSVMKGYYGDEEVTKMTMDAEGWLCSGDIVYYDDDGFFYIVDRLKELIKYKGFQVPPAELEALLATHPKIKEACVVGLPDERCGELPLAFVVKEPNQDLSEQEVVAFIADKVAPEKQLRGGVRFIDEIPKSPIGKLLRKDLRALISTTENYT